MAAPALTGRRVLLGLTGGIAAYKAPELVRALQKRGATVHCVATENALRLVSRDALATLTGHAVEVSAWDHGGTAHTQHIDWAQWAEILVIAPLTANSAAKLAHGLADDSVSQAWISCTCPKLVAPAMNTRMLRAPATVRNLHQLSLDGAHVMPPDSGDLACGESGEGRMPDPVRIADEVERLLAPKAAKPLRILLTMGRTEEPVDDVRVLTNRSSGRTGADIARAALLRGHHVTVVRGPCEATLPQGVEVLGVRTALQMRDAALSAWPDHDVAVCAAAVADFRPKAPEAGKIAASRDLKILELVPNPDILAELCTTKGARKVVGFALEAGDLSRGSEKLAAKGADLAVCNNPLHAADRGGFGESSVWAWIGKAGQQPQPTWMDKTDLASRLVQALEDA